MTRNLRDLDDGFGHWLAGFIDGEGCFFFHKRKGQFSPPQFAIKLRDDDHAILLECAARTGLGRVIGVDRSSGPSRPQAKWILSRRADCRALVDLLDKYPLRAKKRRDFLIWREAVILWADQKRTGKPGRGSFGYRDSDRIQALHKQLTEVRAYAS